MGVVHTSVRATAWVCVCMLDVQVCMWNVCMCVRVCAGVCMCACVYVYMCRCVCVKCINQLNDHCIECIIQICTHEAILIEIAHLRTN